MSFDSSITIMVTYLFILSSNASFFLKHSKPRLISMVQAKLTVLLRDAAQDSSPKTSQIVIIYSV